MALTTITNSMVSVNAIQGTLIADNAITAVHIATNAVSSTLIADNAITAVHIAQNSITVTQLADDAVEADKIADGIITTNHLNKAMISSQTEVAVATGDFVLLGDTSDSNNLKKAPISSILAGTLTTAAQTNITSLGTLTSFRSTGIDDNADALAITIDSSERVGIGTTAPNRTLTVYGSSNGEMNLKNSSADFLIQQAGHNTSIGNSSSSGYINFFTNNGSANVRMLANGNVGIGDVAPNDKLQVVGTITSQPNIVSNASYNIFSARSGRTINDYGGLDKQYMQMNLVTPGSSTTGESNNHVFGDLRFAFVDGGDTTLHDRVTFRHNGNVGIGTASPDSLLHIYEDDSSASNTQLHIENDKTDDAAVLRIEGKRTSANDTAQILFANNGNLISAIKAYSAADDGDIRFYTSATSSGNTVGAERMRIEPGGDVGIGTASPAQRLHVAGGHMHLDTGMAITWDNTHERIEQSDTKLEFFTDNSEKMTLKGANLGIGTTSPNTKLHVSSTGGTQLRITAANDNYAYIEFGDTDDEDIGRIVYSNIHNRMDFHVNTADRMHISSTGNVGIGNASPQKNLTIGSSQGEGIQFTYDATNNYRSQILTYWTSSTDSRMDFNIARSSGVTPATIMSVGYGGNVGIGVTSPTELLHIKNQSNSWDQYARIRIGSETNDNYAAEIGFHRGTSSDADRGFFISGDGSTNHVKVLHTGLVGIGTMTPAKLLTVHYAAPAYNTVDDVLRLVSKFTSSNNAASAYAGSGPAIVFAGGIGDNQTRDRARIVGVYEGSNQSGLAFHTQDTADIITEKMRITSAAGGSRLGIGITNPATKLANTATRIGNADGLTTHLSGINWVLSGQGYTAALSNTSTSGGSHNAGLLVELASTDATDKILDLESGGVNRVRVLGTGNVLIGTTSTSTQGLSSGGGTVISAAGGVASAYQSASATDPVLSLNNTGTEGHIAQFRHNGTNIGNISSISSAYLAVRSQGGNLRLGANNTDYWSIDEYRIYPITDAVDDLGLATNRIRDIHVSGKVKWSKTGTSTEAGYIKSAYIDVNANSTVYYSLDGGNGYTIAANVIIHTSRQGGDHGMYQYFLSNYYAQDVSTTLVATSGTTTSNLTTTPQHDYTGNGMSSFIRFVNSGSNGAEVKLIWTEAV